MASYLVGCVLGPQCLTGIFSKIWPVQFIFGFIFEFIRGDPARTATEPRREIFTRSNPLPRKWIMVHMRIGCLFRTLRSVYRPSICQKLNPDTQRQLADSLGRLRVRRAGGHYLLMKPVSHASVLEIFGGISLFQGSV